MNIGGNNQSNEKKPQKNDDIFDFLNSGEQPKQQPIVNNPPQKQQNQIDLINNIFEKEYGMGNNSQPQQQQQPQAQVNNNNFSYPNVSQVFPNNNNPLVYPNMSNQQFPQPGQNQFKPAVDNKNPLDDLFDFSGKK